MYRGYLIDMDGTLYKGKERIVEAEQFVHKLLEKEIPFRLVTNNATRSVAEIVESLNQDFHLPVKAEHIYTSTLALVEELVRNHAGQKLLVIGEPALTRTLEEAGFELVDDSKAGCVIQGLQRDVNYSQLATAVQAILNGADYLVTNTDRLIPTELGYLPSSGALTAFISYASQKQATIFGKPYTPIMMGALSSIQLKKDEVLMIGDNYETDIMAGINSGIDTLLVLTGVTNEADVEHLVTMPKYIVHSLSEWDLN